MKKLFFYSIILSCVTFSRVSIAYCPCPVPPFTYCACCAICPTYDGANDAQQGSQIAELQKIYEEGKKYYDQAMKYKSLLGELTSLDFDANGLINIEKIISQMASDYATKTPQSFPAIVKNIKDNWFAGDNQTTQNSQEKENNKQEDDAQRVTDSYALSLSIQNNLEQFQKEIEPLQTEINTLASKASEAENDEEIEAAVLEIKQLAAKIQMKWLEVRAYENSLQNVSLNQESTSAAATQILAAFPAHDLPEPQPTTSKNGPFKSCMDDCSNLMDQTQEASQTLDDAIGMHNKRMSDDNYNHIEQQTLSMINEHKRVSAQLHVAEQVVLAHLKKLFVDPQQAFFALMEDIHKQNGPNDAVYDDSFFLNMGVSYNKSIETSQQIMKKLHELAKPEPNTNPPVFPIESYLGTLLATQKACHEYNKNNICIKYKVQKSLEDMDAPLLHDNIIYPPVAADQTNDADLEGLKPEDIKDAEEKLKSAKNQMIDIPYYEIDAASYKSPSEYNMVQQPTKTIAYLTYLDNAIAFLQESEKHEAYLWYTRYGANPSTVISQFSKLSNFSNDRYEGISPPPVWYQLKGDGGAWWSNLPQHITQPDGSFIEVAPEFFHELDERPLSKIPSALEPECSTLNKLSNNGLQNTSGGAEYMLIALGKNRDCNFQDISEIIDRHEDLNFNGKVSNNKDAIIDYSNANPQHLEFALMKKLAQTILSLEAELAKKATSTQQCNTLKTEDERLACDGNMDTCGCDIKQLEIQITSHKTTLKELIGDFIEGDIDDAINFLDNANYQDIEKLIKKPKKPIYKGPYYKDDLWIKNKD